MQMLSPSNALALGRDPFGQRAPDRRLLRIRLDGRQGLFLEEGDEMSNGIVK